VNKLLSPFERATSEFCPFGLIIFISKKHFCFSFQVLFHKLPARAVVPLEPIIIFCFKNIVLIFSDFFQDDSKKVSYYSDFSAVPPEPLNLLLYAVQLLGVDDLLIILFVTMSSSLDLLWKFVFILFYFFIPDFSKSL